MSDTETVSLNLDGNFDAKAEKDASAADKLTAALEKLEKAEAKLAKTKESIDKANLAANKASGFGGKTPTSLLQSVVQGAFPKVVGAVGRVFGDNAAAGLVKGAAKLAEVSDALKPYMPLIEAGGGVLKAGAGALASAGAVVASGAAATAAAAAALGVAAGALVVAGIKLGISEATKNEVQGSILNALTGGKGEGAMKLATKVALDLGIDDDVAIDKLKKLLNAKFNGKQSELIIKVGLGLDAAMGAGTGDKFAKTLETIKLAGKFDAKAVKQFAKEGISAEEIYAKLAKSLGVSVDVAKAKVKAGTIDIDKGIEGVLAVADKKFGGIADKLGNSIPGLFTKIQVGIKGLFGNIDLGPIKGVLKNVLGVITGPAGEGFSKAFGKLSDTIIKMFFGPISGAAGKDKMTGVLKTITQGVELLNAKLKEAAPTIKKAADFLLDLLVPKQKDGPGAKVRELARDFVKLYNDAKPVASAILAIAKVALPAAMFLFTASTKAWGVALNFIIKPIAGGIEAIQKLVNMVTGSAPKAAKGGKAIGKAIPDGILQGILGGAGGALAAAGNLAAQLLARVKSVLGVASPSKAFAFIGAMNAQGMAKGMNDNAQAPAQAAAKMAAGTAAAAGAAGGKGKGGGAGGEAAPVFQITVMAAPGMTEAQAKAIGGAVGDGAYEAWRTHKRKYDRELQEGRAA